MPVTRLNHAVLYVRDVDASVTFYASTLGFRTVMTMPGAAFLQANGSNNDHDLGLFQVGAQAGPSDAGRTTVGLYHLAWEVDTLDELGTIRDRLMHVGALAGATDHGTTKALYAKDPDGIEFEVSWLVPASLLSKDILESRETVRPLDLAADVTRFGGQTPGGIGISIPVQA